jgi:hypothetical protein
VNFENLKNFEVNPRKLQTKHFAKMMIGNAGHQMHPSMHQQPPPQMQNPSPQNPNPQHSSSNSQSRQSASVVSFLFGS